MKFSVCYFTEKQNKNIISLYNAVFEYLQTTNIFCFLFLPEKKKFHLNFVINMFFVVVFFFFFFFFWFSFFILIFSVHSMLGKNFSR